MANTLLAEQQPPRAPAPLSPAERGRQILFDLGAACNITSEELVATKFTFDHMDSPMPLSQWWGNPSLTLQPSPRVVETTNGVRFLTSGRPRPGLGAAPKNLLALSSWQPHPLPGGAAIMIGARCERLLLLLQGYVHPMKNYLPNGEVVLRYADGTKAITPLIPPFNLDCYFQHFSREGLPLALGQCGSSGKSFSFVSEKWVFAHADALEIPCDPSRELAGVELRATCSEGVLGLAAMTAIAAED